jgi:N-acyl-phosphatidylethanolamine-hydrolysing phospholipase D
MSSHSVIQTFIRSVTGPRASKLSNITPRRALWQNPRFSTTVKMSSMGGAGIGAGLYAMVSNPAQVAAQPEDAKDKAHHLKNAKGFINPWDSFVETSPFQFMRMMFWSVLCSTPTPNRNNTNSTFRRKITGQTKKPDTSPPTVPVRTPSFGSSRETPKLRATWLGHACYYVEFPGGLRVLFDPVFEDCCAPINLKGLRRYTPPPCEIEDLPMVDVVVISHNHYDHLSYPTILRIQKKFPEAHFFAPLGNKVWFEKCGITKVTELDWWESRDVKLEMRGGEKAVSVSSSEGHDKPTGSITATIGALPCQHVSARTPFDKCKTLWASWSVESGGSKVWFAGYVFPSPSSTILTFSPVTQAIVPCHISPLIPTTMVQNLLTCHTAPPLHKSANTAVPLISVSFPLARTNLAGCSAPCMRIQKIAQTYLWIQSVKRRWVCIGARGF